MIAADVEQLASALYQRHALILEKELGYIYRDLVTIGTQAALLAGFAFSSINLQGNQLDAAGHAPATDDTACSLFAVAAATA
jgi:hypothetical protein